MLQQDLYTTLSVREIGILIFPFGAFSKLKILAWGTRQANLINVNKMDFATSVPEKLHANEGKHGSVVG